MNISVRYRPLFHILTVTTIFVLLSKALFIFMSIYNSLFLQVLYFKPLFIFGYIIAVYVISPMLILLGLFLSYAGLKVLFNKIPNSYFVTSFLLNLLIVWNVKGIIGSVGSLDISMDIVNLLIYLFIATLICILYFKFTKAWEQ